MLDHVIIDNKVSNQDISKSIEVIRFNFNNLQSEAQQGINKSNPPVTKNLSKFKLFFSYLFKSKKDSVKKVLYSYYQVVQKSLSVETIYRNNFELKLFNYLFLHNDGLKIDKIFKNLYNNENCNNKLLFENTTIRTPKIGEKTPKEILDILIGNNP